MMVTSRSLLILAGVESIRDRHYAYSSCGRCYSKVLFDSDTARWVCIKCRSNRPNVLRRYRMNFRITDSSRLANVTVFGHNLDKFFGCTADEFYENLESLSRICPHLINETLVDSVIADTFVGDRFLFGFKLPQHATLQDITWNTGNIPMLDMILPNPDDSSFPDVVQNAEASNTVAWQMLFACSDQHFMTVLARLRHIVDHFGSSQRLNSAANESLIFAPSGCETFPSLVSSVEGRHNDFIDRTELSLVLSCDQVGDANVEPKDLNEGISGYSSTQSFSHWPGSLLENSVSNAVNDKLILNNVPRTDVEALGFLSTQSSEVLPSRFCPVSNVSEGNRDSGFRSNALIENVETRPDELNKVNCKKSNTISTMHLNNEPERLKQDLEKKRLEVSFGESSIDEIEMCRGANATSQERPVLAADFSRQGSITLAVSQELKKRNSLNIPLQPDIHVAASAQHESCTLDLIEAPYSEDLDAFLRDYEENERLTCELPAASDSERIGCRLRSVSNDSLSKNRNSGAFLEQPYSEDLDEFLKGCSNSDKEHHLQVHSKPLGSNSILQHTSFKDSYASSTTVLGPCKPLVVSSFGALTESGCSDELFSFWGVDFEQQGAHTSISKSIEEPTRQCSLQHFVAESPLKQSNYLSCHSNNHLKDLSKNNSLRQLAVEHFSRAKTEEIIIRNITSLGETKENLEPRANPGCTPDIEFSSSVVPGQNVHCLQKIRKSTHNMTSSIATPSAIYTKKAPRLESFLNCRTPVNAAFSSFGLRAKPRDSCSSKSICEQSHKDRATDKDVIVFKRSIQKAGSGTVSTEINQSFDLFQSPCFNHTGLSRRLSRSRGCFPSSAKFQFSSTPLNTVRTGRPISDTNRGQERSPAVIEDFPHGPADSDDIEGTASTQRVETSYVATAVVPDTRRTCRLNSRRKRTSSIAGSESAGLVGLISPELFGDSFQLRNFAPSPSRTVHRTAPHLAFDSNHEEIPVDCNLFNSASQVVDRDFLRDSILSGSLAFNESEDLFGYSGDLFLD